MLTKTAAPEIEVSETNMTTTKSTSTIILSGNAYNNFAETIKSQKTLEGYRRGIKRFMQYCSITDINNLLNLGNQNPKIIQQKIIDHILYPKNQR
jgi:hypothetical protein